MRGAKTGRITYHAAVTNSIRALGATGRQNTRSAPATVARIDFDVLQPYGLLETSPTPVAKPQFSAGLALASNPVVETSSVQNVTAGDRTKNATVDAGFRWLRFSTQGAGYARWNGRQGLGLSSTRDTGAYLQTGFYVDPRHWEIVARVSQVSFETVARQSSAVREYTAGVNRYFHDHHMKLQADYTRANLAWAAPGASGLDHRFRLQGQLFF
jgi:hypothetical protein